MENENKMPLARKNYILIAISVLVCIIGYAMMIGGGTSDPEVFDAEQLYSFRRTSLSVIFVLAGHAMMIYAIMYRKKDNK